MRDRCHIVADMVKILLVGAALVACKGSGPETERYAVGTYLFSGSVMTGASNCTYDAPAGVLDGTKILKPGTINETCPSGYKATIIADYADHVALTFEKTAKVGQSVYFRAELRDAQDHVLTPTLSEMDRATLEPGCTALTNVGRGGAQDTGRDPFMSATAAAAGQCKVTVEIDVPTATGKKLQAEQVVVVK